MLILSGADVEQLFTREMARDAVRQGAVAHFEKRATTPPRVQLDVPHVGGEMLVMPGHLSDGPVLGIKVVSAFPGNESLGVPVTLGAVLLLNPDTGMPVALVDAGYLTAVRTAAITAVACEHLARRDSRVLALIGTGAMAREHVDAIADVLPIDEVRVWSRTPQRVQAFVDEFSGRRPVSAAASAEAAVRGADVVVAITTSLSPVVRSSWVGPGVLVCGAGSHTPDAAELDPEIMARASVIVVDTWQGGVGGAGDVAQPLAAGMISRDIVHELGEVIRGGSPGRRSADELTVFKGVGFAAADLAAATMVVERALTLGVGHQVSM